MVGLINKYISNGVAEEKRVGDDICIWEMKADGDFRFNRRRRRSEGDEQHRQSEPYTGRKTLPGEKRESRRGSGV